MDKLGVFYANQTPMCLDPHMNYCSIAPKMEHSFSFLKFYMKVSSP